MTTKEITFDAIALLSLFCILTIILYLAIYYLTNESNPMLWNFWIKVLVLLVESRILLFITKEITK